MLEQTERRAYLTQALSDHRRLDAKLRELRGAIEAAPVAAVDAGERIDELLKQLRNELQWHFDCEQEGGCLDEVVARLPRLSFEADRIQAQHEELLDEIDRLIDEAREYPYAHERFLEHLDAFYRQFHEHEEAEDQLLREGFGLADKSEDLIH